MKKFAAPILFLSLLLALFSFPASTQTTRTEVYSYATSLSGVKCQPTQAALWIIRSGGSAGVYRCGAVANTFDPVGGGGGGASYLVYSALITQGGSNAPNPPTSASMGAQQAAAPSPSAPASAAVRAAGACA
jgi:hypothetical protein